MLDQDSRTTRVLRGQIDLQRYQGIWYEEARLPMFFQRNCVRSQANYRLRDDGSVAVTNRRESS